jgi:NADP-dependent 3-hydroxy acid dehydrogenase YdfG
MFKTIEEKFKYVDILVNNAGLGHPDDLMNGRTEKWRGMIDVSPAVQPTVLIQVYKSAPWKEKEDT